MKDCRAKGGRADAGRTAHPARTWPIAHPRCENGLVFKWHTARAIGVPEIDAQHMALFEGAVKAPGAQDQVRTLLVSLAEQAAEHFIAEEQLMRGVGYPRLAEHAQEHAYFTLRFRSAEHPHRA
jgi:hemerythrin-like metal-binding protein